MKTDLGGKRLGSGANLEVNTRTFNRTTHDLSEAWRSSMAAGTLVPFMSKVGLPGDVWNIDLMAEVVTLPTVGPLFGSYKVQLDVFSVPMRLFHSGLITNRINIGNNMKEVKLPKVTLAANTHEDYEREYKRNEQINASSIFKYLGISGLGSFENITSGTAATYKRNFNAIPYLSYWSIFKQYYANKQEENAYVIHTGNLAAVSTTLANITNVGSIYNQSNDFVEGSGEEVYIGFPAGTTERNPDLCKIWVDGIEQNLTDTFGIVNWSNSPARFECALPFGSGSETIQMRVNTQAVPAVGETGEDIHLQSFPLENIDKMTDEILQTPWDEELIINADTLAPYGTSLEYIDEDEELTFSYQYGQEGLAVKTYQSDLFNNWINTEWIDGTNGINEITSVDTTGDSFTIDALNLAQKVYLMLNAIAVSGGSYDDFLAATYNQERIKAPMNPVYHGSLIKELAFEEVISNSETEGQPLGTLAGRGRLTQKDKGGKMTVKCDEWSYIMGIVSITPRVNYSQGNEWDVNLDTFDDFHKPHLDAIGFQDLITEQMLYSDSVIDMSTGELTQHSAGKQPAWLNYMTSYDKVYGNFAEENKDAFMILDRNYENDTQGRITDLTTYIDPSKFNNIFAQTSLDSQNFWVQIGKGIKVRRKMSAKVIPNL